MMVQSALEFAQQIWRGLCNADYSCQDVANLITARDDAIRAEERRAAIASLREPSDAMLEADGAGAGDWMLKARAGSEE